MLRVYKYPIAEIGITNAVMPRGAHILTVQTQYNTPCIWALVNPDASPVAVDFLTLGTGHPFPDDDEWPRYVGTFQLDGGSLVFHVFGRESGS